MPIVGVVSRRKGEWRPLKKGVIREYVGRPGPLGNPFSHIESGTLAQHVTETRDEAINAFERLLRTELATGTLNDRTRALARITTLAAEHDIELECWCAPLRCHAEVIKRIIEEQLNQ